MSKLHANSLTAFVVFTFLFFGVFFVSFSLLLGVYFVFALSLPLLVFGFFSLRFPFFTAFIHHIHLIHFYHTPAAARCCDDSKYLSTTYFSMQFIWLISLSVSFIICFDFSLLSRDYYSLFSTFPFSAFCDDFGFSNLSSALIEISTLACCNLLNTFNAQHTLFMHLCLPLKIFKLVLFIFYWSAISKQYTKIITLVREITQTDAEINKRKSNIINSTKLKIFSIVYKLLICVHFERQQKI